MAKHVQKPREAELDSESGPPKVLLLVLAKLLASRKWEHFSIDLLDPRQSMRSGFHSAVEGFNSRWTAPRAARQLARLYSVLSSKLLVNSKKSSKRLVREFSSTVAKSIAMPFVLANSLTTPMQNFVADLVKSGMAFSKRAVFSSSKRQEKRWELSLSITQRLTNEHHSTSGWHVDLA